MKVLGGEGVMMERLPVLGLLFQAAVPVAGQMGNIEVGDYISGVTTTLLATRRLGGTKYHLSR